jgi:hypothetical protein
MSNFEIAALKNAVLQGFSGRLKASKTAKTNFKITDFEIGSVTKFPRRPIDRRFCGPGRRKNPQVRGR